jgi:hypothetical protein
MAHKKVNEYRLMHREQQHLNFDAEASKAIQKQLDALAYETNADTIVGLEWMQGFIKETDFAGVAVGGDYANCNQIVYYNREDPWVVTNAALPPNKPTWNWYKLGAMLELMQTDTAVNDWYGGGKWYDYDLGKKKCIPTGGTERAAADGAGYVAATTAELSCPTGAGTDLLADEFKELYVYNAPLSGTALTAYSSFTIPKA